MLRLWHGRHAGRLSAGGNVLVYLFGTVQFLSVVIIITDAVGLSLCIVSAVIDVTVHVLGGCLLIVPRKDIPLFRESVMTLLGLLACFWPPEPG